MITMIISIFASCLISITLCILLSKDIKPLKNLQKLLVPFAAGALLAVIFCDLFPEAIELANEKKLHNVFYAALIGFVIFFLLETTIHNFHHHHETEREAEDENHAANLVFVGGIFHTIIDGVIIGLSFLVDIHIGFVTVLAISAHKIPQEIGNFAILLKEKGRKKSLILISVISFSAVFGALISFSFGKNLELILPELLGLTAGFFMYISASDIVPSIRKSKNKIGQVFAFIFGIVIVSLLIVLLHSGTH